MALAIQASLYDTCSGEPAYPSLTTTSSMEEEDRALAQAIADSEKKVTEDRPTPSTKLSGGRGREDTRNEQQTVETRDY